MTVVVWCLALLALCGIWLARVRAEDVGRSFTQARARTNEDAETAAFQLQRHVRQRAIVLTGISVIATAAVITGSVYATVIAPALNDVEQESRASLFIAGYQDRWRSDCQYIFGTLVATPNGVLYNGDTAYDVGWCAALQSSPEVPAGDIPANAYERGRSSGFGAGDAVAARVEALCWGGECTVIAAALLVLEADFRNDGSDGLYP